MANRCTRLATFTYREAVWDRARVVADWHRFAVALREAGYSVAWLRVLEMHPGGHGFHVHAGLGSFVPKTVLARVWGHGFVDVRKLRSRTGGRADGRAAAVYLAKYAGKAAVASPGEHAYEVAQGFTVRAVELTHDHLAVLQRFLDTRMEAAPAYEWWSDGTPDWTGPPAGFCAW